MLDHFAFVQQQPEPARALCRLQNLNPNPVNGSPGMCSVRSIRNLASVKTALQRGTRHQIRRAVAYDRRSALDGLRRAAETLAPGVLTVYDEDMRVASHRREPWAVS